MDGYVWPRFLFTFLELIFPSLFLLQVFFSLFVSGTSPLPLFEQNVHREGTSSLVAL